MGELWGKVNALLEHRPSALEQETLPIQSPLASPGRRRIIAKRTRETALNLQIAPLSGSVQQSFGAGFALQKTLDAVEAMETRIWQ